MKCDGSTACESELRTELKNLTLKYRCSSLVVVIFIWAMVPLYEWGRGFMQIESFLMKDGKNNTRRDDQDVHIQQEQHMTKSLFDARVSTSTSNARTRVKR